MENFVVFGIPATVLVVLIVELLKRFKVVSGDGAILAAIVTGVALAVLNKVAELVPGFEAWYAVVFIGVLAGFAASGLYDGTTSLASLVKGE
jgi:hypothetical protein